MNKDEILTGIIIEESTTYSFREVCQQYQIPEELLIEIIEIGFFPHQSTDIKQIELDQKSLRKLETAFRLHRDLHINLPGVALAVDLLEQIERLQKELDVLHKHF